MEQLFDAMVGSNLSGIGSLADLWALILNDLKNIGDPKALATFGKVIFIDIVFAADNAIVVGALAGGLPPQQRRKVIFFGIMAALILRIFFALSISLLLSVIGLVFLGGILLLFVAWKFWRDIRSGVHNLDSDSSQNQNSKVAERSFWAAMWGVMAADVSMSLDNVLAVAGAARDHPGVLVIGLILSVILMGIAANYIARLMGRYPWIGYIGLLVIVYVAGQMIYDGIFDPITGISQLF